MGQNYASQKSLPIITSILIILLVALLRERSRTLAAILATMPINLPLGLWVVFGGDAYDPETAALFVRALMPGLAATMLWVVGVYVLVRLGVNLWLSILGGYVVWGVLVFAFIRLGWMVVNR